MATRAGGMSLGLAVVLVIFYAASLASRPALAGLFELASLASVAGGAALLGFGAWLRRHPGQPESAAATTPAQQRSVEFSRGGAAALGPRWYRRMLVTGILFACAGLAAGVAILSAAPGTTAYTELGILAFALALAGIVVGAAGYSTRER